MVWLIVLALAIPLELYRQFCAGHRLPGWLVRASDFAIVTLMEGRLLVSRRVRQPWFP